MGEGYYWAITFSGLKLPLSLSHMSTTTLKGKGVDEYLGPNPLYDVSLVGEVPRAATSFAISSLCS